MIEKTWQQTLREAKYPTTAIVLDFETFRSKEYSLSKSTTVEYVQDLRFAFTGLGLSYFRQPYDDPENTVFYPPNNIRQAIMDLQRAFGSNLEGCTIVGQNLLFDALILVEKFGILPPYTVDIRDLARHEDARRKNDLDSLCKVYKLPIRKGNIKETIGLHWDDMSPELQNKEAQYCHTDVYAEGLLFQLLLPRLSNPNVELPLQRQTLHLFLNSRITVDYNLADKLCKQMNAELQSAVIKVIKYITPYVTRKKDFLQIIRSDKYAEIITENLYHGQQCPMKQGKNKMIPALAKTDLGFQMLLSSSNKVIKRLAEARLAAKSWPNHIKRVKSIANQCRLRKNKLGVPLFYYAAHTGR